MNIWVPKLKIIEAKDYLPAPGGRVGGLFMAEGVLPDGRRRLIQDWTPNLVTDYGLNRWATAQPFAYCAVGSGTTEPTVLDTALVAHVASISIGSISIGAQSSAPYYGWSRWTSTFAPPGDNHNLGEVGFGATGGVGLWSRMLFKDQDGDPTTVSWLANETLIITYEMRNYPVLDDLAGQVTIGGDSPVTHDVLMRSANVASGSYQCFGNLTMNIGQVPQGGTNSPLVYSGAIGAITAQPTGTSTSDVPTMDTYSNGSLKRTGTCTWASTVANYAGGVVSLLGINVLGSWQCQFTPPIMKTSLQSLTLGLSTGPWGRV